jgi:putative hydrolase of the HAD superfamily
MHPKIEYILFDLDSTLYSARYGLEKNVSRRVNEYISRLLGLSMEESWQRRIDGIKARGFGTTIEWLTAGEGFPEASLDDYFAYIHPETEADELPPNPELRPFLQSLGLPMSVLTNSTREHTLRILKKLEIEDLFASIFDIRGRGLKGKPRPEAFYYALEAVKSTPEHCLFVDDVVTYVAGYRALGGAGVLFDEFDKHPEFPDPRIRKLEEIRNFLD